MVNISEAKKCPKGEILVKGECKDLSDLLHGKWFLDRKHTDVSHIKEPPQSPKGVYITLYSGRNPNIKLLAQAQTGDEWDITFHDEKGVRLKW